MARNINQLHPWMQYKIYLLKKECKKQGLQLGIGECFRSVKEQEDLYAKGRSAPGKIVTNARGKSFSSQHQWGIGRGYFPKYPGKRVRRCVYEKGLPRSPNLKKWVFPGEEIGKVLWIRRIFILASGAAHLLC